MRAAFDDALWDEALHAWVGARHSSHEAAAVAASHEADALRVHRWRDCEEADRRADVLGLVGVVHLPAQSRLACDHFTQAASALVGLHPIARQWGSLYQWA